MERLRINHLQPGRRLTQPLFSSTGQKLLSAGVLLNDRHIQALKRCEDTDVFLANTLDELVEAGLVRHFDSSRLAVGQTSEQGILTTAGQVVLEPGQEIEEHHMDALAVDGSTFVNNQQLAMSQRRERVLLADTLVEELLNDARYLELRIEPDTGKPWVQPREEGWPSPDELVALRHQAVNRLRHFYARIEAGQIVSIREFEMLVDPLVDLLAGHPTRFTQLALLCPRRQDYLPDHAYTVAVLAMAIAQQMGWSRHATHQVGLAGLMFDLGMLLVPERIRTGACELTDIDRSRVQRHPVFTLAMMQMVDSVDPILQLAALQHHERENGSGYPQGLRREATCDHARVLAVADCFAATTEPRHYRNRKLPYVAMEETIRSTSALALWKPAVRALLQAAGLFPVGSYVKLSDGSQAQVLASHPTQLDRPMVQPLDEQGQPKGKAIDLTQHPTDDLAVVRPIAPKTA